MNKLILITLGVFFISTSGISQYKLNKTKYDYKTYLHQVGDPYNPTVAGLASFFIPGLGQMLSGEIGRGLVYLGGYIVCSTIFLAGSFNMLIYNGGPTESGLRFLAVGGLMLLSYQIWTIVDAIRVSKVNNLAFRDKNISSYLIKVHPYFGFINYYSNIKSVAGLSFKISF